MTLEDFYDNLCSIYQEYMESLKTAQSEFKSAIENLSEDASRCVDPKYSGAIKAMLDEKAKALNDFSDSFEEDE